MMLRTQKRTHQETYEDQWSDVAKRFVDKLQHLDPSTIEVRPNRKAYTDSNQCKTCRLRLWL